MPNVVFDAERVREHVTLLHDLAARVGSGKLVAVGFAESVNGGPQLKEIKHFAIGDAENMALWIERLARQPGWNVYVSLSVFQPDLPAWSKGSEVNVVAVLGLVMDFDDAQAADYNERLPMPPDMVLETSEGRFQCMYLFDAPVSPEEAKQIANAITEESGADACSKDIAHIWRVPGTLNWPTARKRAQGRKLEPQLVQMREEPEGNRTPPALLPHGAPIHVGYVQPNGPEPATEMAAHANAGSLLERLRSQSRTRFIAEKLDYSPPEGQRSGHIYNVVGLLKGEGLPQQDAVVLLRSSPAGDKYASRPLDDLAREVERCWGRTNDGAEPFKPGALDGFLSAPLDGYRLLSRSDLANLPKAEYLVQGIVPKRGLVGIAGQPSTYKSFLALDLLGCIASGVRFHGVSVQQGHAVYIAAEGMGGLHKRVCAWEMHHGQKVPDERFAIIPDVVLLNLPDCLTKLIATLQARVEQYGSIDFILLDTLSRTFSGDENSPELAGYVRAIDQLREAFGAAVGVVHHTPKDSSEKSGAQFFRGHSSFFGAMDVGLSMRRRGAQVEFCPSEKEPKDDEPLPNMLLRAQQVDLTGILPPKEDGTSPTSLVLVPCDAMPSSAEGAGGEVPKVEAARNFIINCLRGGAMAQADLWAAFDPEKQEKTRKQIGRAVDKLRQDGDVAFGLDGKLVLNGYGPLAETVADTCPDTSGQSFECTP